jgi:polyketide synthase PksJ
MFRGVTLWQKNRDDKKRGKLDKKNIEDVLALTPMQEGMLFHYLKAPDSDYYFEQLSLEISGQINKEIFEKAWNFVIETNEMLRTVFQWEKVEKPIQVILKEHRLQPGYYDFPGEEGSQKNRKIEEIKLADRKEKFDLRKVPFRVTLCRIEKAKHVMMISNHHILYDGWSNGIILKEFFRTYDDLVNGKELLKPVKTKFKEFVKWIQDQDSEKQEKFWQEYLRGFDTQTELSVKKRKGREITGIATDSFRVNFSRDLKDKIEDFVKSYKITLATLFYSAWGILLERYNNSEDVIFGTTVSGRNAKVQGIEEIAGLFINTLPLRIRTDANEKAGDFLYRLDKELQRRETFETTNLVEIKGYSEIDIKEELFDSLVVIENYPLDSRLRLENSNLSVDSYSIFERTHYDLVVTISAFRDFELAIVYNKNVFDEDTVVRLSNHFRCTVENIMENSGKVVTDIEIILEEEKNKILYEFNDTEASYPQDKTIQQLFAEQVDRTPDNMAIVFEDNQLTYQELHKRSDRLAWILREKGAKGDSIIGIMAERSMEMVTAILSILKTGGAYLPLEPAYPSERINFILKDIENTILLTQKKFLAGRKNECEAIDIEDNRLYNIDLGSPGTISRFHPHHAAYVIYTSGSTGKPKGVMIEHTSVLNLLNALQKTYPLLETDVYLLKTSYVFDVSVTELFGWFLGGGRLVILEKGSEKDPGKILDVIEKQGITHINFVPTMFNVFTDSLNPKNIIKLSRLKYVFLAGEAVWPELVKRFKQLSPWIVAENIYGPTEATIYATSYSLSQWAGSGNIPIGKPMQNIRVYILDRHRLLQPIGVAGELCISGIGVARGYLNNPDLTAEKFCHLYKNFLLYHSPLTTHLSPLYLTGDLTCWRPDGNIEFLGRLDHQVKIRGYRIELGEIEAQLSFHEEIKQAVVTVQGDETNEVYLVAYIVSKNKTKTTTTQLRKYLFQKLPDYMVPVFFIQVDKIPLIPSGKVDQKALFKSGKHRPRLKTNYVAPGNDAEKTITSIWMELLKLDKVGLNDNFFDLGGNSFNIIRLNNKLKEIFQREVPLVTLFNYPTISAQAKYFNRDEGSLPVETEAHHGEKETSSVQACAAGMDIAVIGMAGRFPGARNIDEFWDNLKNGKESITFFTDEELEALGVIPEHYNNPHYVKAKGVLENMNYFDSLFFDYSAREARLMGPQFRLLHECVWEALENAGYVPGSSKVAIGLYVGALSNAGWMQQLNHEITTHSDLLAVGSLNDRDYLATRISYQLNLKGPAITVQTACSTSLVAIDTACQALLGGRCRIALAGGVALTLQDRGGYLHEEGMLRSPDGHCRPFDAGAKGTVGGNGVGIVVLKPLKEAATDRDNIRAVIKGSATNNDGARKVGYTAPSVEGQVEVIRSALEAAGVDPGTITYLETHGTGTILGDPVEIEALKQAFNMGKKGFCALGAVKANIGHLDTAAGVAGFIKTVLALEHKMIPPLVNFITSNPHIDFKNSPFYVNTQLKKWKNKLYPLRAGVSSFGIGGTNGHVILEEWFENRGQKTGKSEYRLILLSTKTQSALKKMALNLSEYLQKNPHLDLSDVAYTLQVGREAFQYRRMAVCSGIDEAIESLSDTGSGKVSTSKVEDGKQQLIFMFPGLGSQYVNMGRELYEKEPSFRQNIDRCIEILKSLLDDDIKEILYPHDFVPVAVKNNPATSEPQSVKSFDKINQTEIAQIIIFIFEYALATLLMKWGIQPQTMIGYSFGEYVAACIAGVFSLEDALKLVVARGQLMKKIPPGAMMSVPLQREELIPLLTEDLSVAVDNGTSCVVSGPGPAVDAFEEQMKKMRCICIRLPVTHAVHSKMMESVLEEFKSELSRVGLNKPRIPYMSNVTGQWIKDQEASDPGYWLTHMRETVRFADGLKELMKKPGSLFLEVGPGHELSSLLVRHLGKNLDQPALNLVRHLDRYVSDVYFLLNKIGFLWLKGIKVDWNEFFPGDKVHRVPLPTYPFEGKCYCIKEAGNENVPGIPDKRSGSKKPDIGDWFYLPQWERSYLLPLASHRFEIPSQSCLLIFIDRSGFSSRLVEQLRRLYQEHRGLPLITVSEGSAFQKTGKQIFEINPRQSEDYRVLLGELRKINRIPTIIVHLWSISTPGNDKEEIEKEMVDEAQEKGLYSLLYLIQAITFHEFTEDIRINVVFTNVHEVTGEERLSPQKTPVLGLAKVIPQEYGNITCRCIDIEQPEPGSIKEKKLMGQLVEEFETNSPDNVIAYRMNYRWVQIFKPIHVKVEDNGKNMPIPNAKKVYLIIGGLGNIGFTLAQYLAKTVKPKLILTGLTELPPRNQWDIYLSSDGSDKNNRVSGKIHKIRKIMKLEENGTEVMYFNCDAAEHEHMQKIIAFAEVRFGPINGVIHAAVSPTGEWFKTFGELDKNEIQKQFRPKVYGLLALDKIFRHKALDFCLIISSPSSILGGLGFGAYAAANAFLDAFVYRSNRVNAVPWITVNWGDWLFEEEIHNDMPLKTPLHYLLMTPEQGVITFQLILNCFNAAVNQVVVSTVDLQERINQWVRFEFHQNRKTEEKRETGTLTVGSREERAELSLNIRHPRPDLMIPYAAPVSGMEKMLSEVWETYFGLEKVGIHDNFFDLGATSMDVIQLNNRLRSMLKRNITITEFFTYPTIKLLANHLSEAPEKEKSNSGKEKFQRTDELKKGRQRVQDRRQIQRGVKV